MIPSSLQLYRSCPAILTPVLPHLGEALTCTCEDTRAATAQLVAELLCSNSTGSLGSAESIGGAGAGASGGGGGGGGRLHSTAQPLVAAWLARFKDASSDVRLQMLGCSRGVLEAGQEPALQTLVSQLAVTNGRRRRLTVACCGVTGRRRRHVRLQHSSL